MPSCKYCGDNSVNWKYLGAKWILHNSDGSRHICVKQKNEGEHQNHGDAKAEPEETGITPEELKDLLNMPVQAKSEPEKTVIEQLQQEGEENDGPESDQKTDTDGNEDKQSKPSEKTQMKKDMLSLPKSVKSAMKDGHSQTLELYALLASGMKVFVSGPAGSGKTTAFKLVAPALGHYFGRKDYDFFFKSVCDLTGKHEFEGFINANGVIVDTDFRKAYVEGHLFLIDEIDAANANVLTVLNATIENGWASFPDGKKPQHPHFRIGVAANTVGLGSDAIYIGRNPLDGAFRNRFFFLNWDYDEKLELRLAGEDQRKWVERVWALRKAHQSLGKLAPRIIISPRASIHGATLIRSKVVTSFKNLEDALIWQGCGEDEKNRVLKAIKGQVAA